MKKLLSILITVILLSIFCTSFVLVTDITDKFILPKNFWFIFISSFLFFLVLSINFLNKKPFKLSLSFLDIIVAVFLIYNAVRLLFTKDSSLLNIEFINLVYLSIFYFVVKYIVNTLFENKETPVVKSASKKEKDRLIANGRQSIPFNYKFLLMGFLLIIIVQSIYGLLQFSGLKPSYHPDFTITGAFGNPGPYTTFLVILAPVALVLLGYRKQLPQLFWLAVLSIAQLLIILPFSQARSAWIAFLVACAYFAFKRFDFLSILKRIFNNTLKKTSLLFLILTVTTLLLVFLYNYKKESSSGRLFIWHNTIEMIKDKPFLGHGFDQFASVYNDYQAQYFDKNPNDTDKIYLAGIGNYAFNDYLQVASEIGLLGLLMFIILLFYPLFIEIDKARSNILSAKIMFSISQLMIIVFSVSCLFSYPLRSIPILALFYFALAIISVFGNDKVLFNYELSSNTRKVVSVLVVLLVLFVFKTYFNRYNAEKKWFEAYNLIRENNYDQAYIEYKELYPTMSYSKYFLFNYGAELWFMGRFDESLSMLKEASVKFNDSEVFLYLGYCYESLSNIPESIKAFEKSYKSMPVKFLPRYKLVMLYDKVGRKEEAKSMAHQIMNMKVKVKSQMINNVRREIAIYLQLNEK